MMVADNQSTASEPDQIDYTRAMLPGLWIGAFLYWSICVTSHLCMRFVRGMPFPQALVNTGLALLVICIAVIVFGFLVRMILIAVNLIFKNPVGCSSLAVCVGGFTLYLLTAWIPLFFLLHEEDIFMFFMTTLFGPLLGVICGSVGVRLYERRQRTYVPYPESKIQFQIRHLVHLTIATAVLLVLTNSFTQRLWLIYPVGYWLFQVVTLIFLGWLPPVRHDHLLQNDNEEMLGFADSGS